MKYIVKGDPIPLARARFGNGKTWDPQKHLKLNWGLVLAHQHGDQPLFTGPLHVDIIFFMPKPKTSAKQRDKLQGQPQFCKPDIDNLQKFCLDCANKIIFKDDALVASITCKKVYDDDPRTIMIVEQIL